MRWETVQTGPEQEIYNLYKGDEKKLTLIFHLFSNSARVECNDEKRVFLIRKEGFLRNRTVIRNEYGIKIGEFGQENRQQFIEVNQERIFYSTQNNPLAQLLLFKDNREQPLVTCGLQTDSGSPSVYFQKDKTLGAMPHPGLLMALCWYLFLPVAKENTVAYAL